MKTISWAEDETHCFDVSARPPIIDEHAKMRDDEAEKLSNLCEKN